jgi:hypothetical protein
MIQSASAKTTTPVQNQRRSTSVFIGSSPPFREGLYAEGRRGHIIFMYGERIGVLALRLSQRPGRIAKTARNDPYNSNMGVMKRTSSVLQRGSIQRGFEFFYIDSKDRKTDRALHEEILGEKLLDLKPGEHVITTDRKE